MKERALVVERRLGEATRQKLVAAGAIREDLAIQHEGSRLAFPLRPEAVVPPDWGETTVREFEPRASEPTAEYRDLLGWPAAERQRLPRSFDVVGDVVLIRLPDELEPRAAEVGEALLKFVPGARLVGLDRGVHGPDRRRAVQRIAGSGAWRTRHRENGLEFDVDLEKAYFSPRLAREHARIAEEVRTGDRVLDLCCGVGPFAVTIARDGRARSIRAVDANPEAVALLRQTLSRYPFGGRVSAIEALLEEFVPSATEAERVLLNLPREGTKYAALVAPLVAPGGSLYYYEIVARDETLHRGAAVERTLGPPGAWRAREVRVVHPYSPSSDLVALTLDRGGV